MQWSAASILELPFADGTFDTVISCETIEHVSETKRAIMELVRVLRPGGRLYLTVPNYLNVWLPYRAYLRLRGRRYSEAGQRVNRVMLLPVVCWWLKRIGLQIKTVDGVRHTLAVWPGRPAIELRFLERWRPLFKWFASQTMIVAEKPEAAAVGLD